MSEQTIRYIIGIDAGGTKTLAKSLDLRTDDTYLVRGSSGSLTNDIEGACLTITDLAAKLLSESQAKPSQTLLICGAAGAEGVVQKHHLLRALDVLQLAQVEVTSDAHISLLGATGGKQGVCVAIGTGSVALRYEEYEVISRFGGWGFLAGDQGSGADLGRNAAREVLKARDRKVDDPLVDELLAIIGTERDEILSWFKHATPADYAGLCPTVVMYRAKSNIAHTLLQKALDDIKELIEVARGDTDLPVYLTGGMGHEVYPYLRRENRGDWLRLGEGDAIDGALLLGRQRVEELG
ncbi:MAG: BadF/BadG/BcrA/BcrD ATPase family protein [Gammaproteobacteria bacterium]